MNPSLIDWRPPGPARYRSFLALGALGLVAIWEAVGRATNGLVLPAPTSILKAAGDTTNQRIIEAASAATVPDIAASFVLGVAAGVSAALIGSIVPHLRHPLQRIALFLSTLPLIILAPILVTIFGVDRIPLAIGSLSSFFPIYVAAASGFSEAPSGLIDLVAALGGLSVDQFRFVRWPNALLMIADGLQLAVLYATFGVLFGEWFGTDRGLGVLLLTSMQNYQVELLWLTALCVTIFTNALAFLIGAMSKLAVRSLV